MLGSGAVRPALLFMSALSVLAVACGSSDSTGDGENEGGVSPDATTVQGRGDAGNTGVGATDSTTTPPVADAGTSDGSFYLPDASETPVDGGGCGYMDSGTPLHVAANLDLCLPKVACTAETCPPQLGDCVNDKCVFKPGYLGVATFPEAWVTYYCDLSSGGCNGVTQINPPATTAQQLASATGLPLCYEIDAGASTMCVGIAASPAMIVGNSQLAVDSFTDAQVKDWGLGLTEASGLCYELTGPGGSVLVALTDRCGGYCECNGSGFEECGPCVNATDMEVQCPCVGSAPPAYSGCCGNGPGCGTESPQCDWCASNSHPHFDLDIGSFNQNLRLARLQGELPTLGGALRPVRRCDGVAPSIEGVPIHEPCRAGGTTAT